MSVCGQGNEDSVSEESGAPVRDLYQQKAASKIVRVLTVLAYLLSVSLAAILLSVYYVCVWKAPELPPQNDTEMSARRASDGNGTLLPLAFQDYDDDGGSNITVKDSAIRQLANASDDFGSTGVPEREGSSEPSYTSLTDDLLADPDPSNTTSENALNFTNSVT